MMIDKKIQELINKGNFTEAKENLESINQQKLRSILLNMGFDNNICAYSFVCFLLLKHETIEYHFLASEILIHCFPHLSGYAASLYHVRRCLQIDPDNVEMLEMLLFFNDAPEKLISDEEAKSTAIKILEKKSDNSAALEILEKS